MNEKKFIKISKQFDVHLKGNESAPGSPWPQPAHISNTSASLFYLVKEKFEIKTNMKVPCDIISENAKLYKNILFPPKIYNNYSVDPSDKLLTKLFISIAKPDICPGFPNSDMDESCLFLGNF